MIGRFRVGSRRWATRLGAGLIAIAASCGSEANPLTPSQPEPDPDPPDSDIATQVAFQVQPADGHLNVVLKTIEVVVRDMASEVVTSSTAPVTISLATNPSGAKLSGTTTVNAVNGVATFSDLVIDRSASYTLTAESPGLAEATSAAFDVVFPMQQVSVGFDHSCAVDITGVTHCWGHNNYGQLGTATPGSETDTPIALTGAPELVTAISGGGHACGLTADGTAYCWGNNVTGQLGDGNAPHNRIAPEPVLGGHVFEQLAAAGTHTCGVATEGDLYCWGYNAQGQLGNSAAGNETDTPVLVEGGHSFTTVTVGDVHTCALTTSAAAYCWGDNYDGALGDGNGGGNSTVPVPVAGNHSFVSLSAGAGHTCGIADTGITYCWGGNYSGQLGDRNLGIGSDIPVAVSGGLTFTALSEGGAEDNHTCAITAAGEAYCWGDNSRGQLGDDGAEDERDVPGLVHGEVRWSGLSTGGNHTCGLAINGAVYCWGYNESGQLGDGNIGENQGVPVRIADPPSPAS